MFFAALGSPYRLAGATVANNGMAGGSIAKISPTAQVVSPSGGYASSFFSQPGNFAVAIAIDNSNNVWVAAGEVLTQLSNSGSLIATPFLQAGTAPFGCSSASFNYASGIAFDTVGNAWITGDTAIYQLNGSSGGNIAGCGYTYSGMSYPLGIAVDSGDYIWIADEGSNEVAKLYSNGSTAQIYSPSSLQSPNALAIDYSNNVWVANYGGTSVTNITSSGTTAYSGGGLINDLGVAVDGSGNAWFTPNTNNNIGAVELSSTGTALSGTRGYATGPSTTSPNAHYWSAIDGSGNVWVANTYADTVSEILGAATPVVTPLATAVINNQLGLKP